MHSASAPCWDPLPTWLRSHFFELNRKRRVASRPYACTSSSRHGLVGMWVHVKQPSKSLQTYLHFWKKENSQDIQNFLNQRAECTFVLLVTLTSICRYIKNELIPSGSIPALHFKPSHFQSPSQFPHIHTFTHQHTNQPTTNKNKNASLPLPRNRLHCSSRLRSCLSASNQPNWSDSCSRLSTWKWCCLHYF